MRPTSRFYAVARRQPFASASCYTSAAWPPALRPQSPGWRPPKSPALSTASSPAARRWLGLVTSRQNIRPGRRSGTIASYPRFQTGAGQRTVKWKLTPASGGPS
jgi:hypothetical protein